MQFSDTIACVLFELLVLELFIVFFPNTFKVPQVSVLFNFQGPVPAALSRTAHLFYHSEVPLSRTFLKFFLSCQPFRLACCLCDSLSILPRRSSFVKNFFEVFLSLSTSCSASHPPVPSLLLSGAVLGMFGFWLCSRRCLARQPDYNTTHRHDCQHLFSIFFGKVFSGTFPYQ